jgi:hypothetical protein
MDSDIWGACDLSYVLVNSMIKFFVLDVLFRRVVAVSTDPAPDSAFAPSFFARPSGQLPSSHCTMPFVSCQAKIVPYRLLVWGTTR